MNSREMRGDKWHGQKGEKEERAVDEKNVRLDKRERERGREEMGEIKKNSKMKKAKVTEKQGGTNEEVNLNIFN